jgi:hypothetical protein
VTSPPGSTGGASDRNRVSVSGVLFLTTATGRLLRK